MHTLGFYIYEIYVILFFHIKEFQRHFDSSQSLGYQLLLYSKFICRLTFLLIVSSDLYTFLVSSLQKFFRLYCGNQPILTASTHGL